MSVFSVVLALIKILAITVFAVLAWWDLRDRRLPNCYIGLCIGLYFLGACAQHALFKGVALHMLTAILGFIVATAMFRFGWIGGGDVKLVGAVFLWAGPASSWIVVCIVSFAGFFLALLMLLLARVTSVTQRSKWSVLHVFEVARGVPYGVALACGGVWAVLQPITHII